MMKVLLNANLLAYQQRIKGTLRRVLQENYVAGVPRSDREDVVLAQEDLLPPPCIVAISLEGYKGHVDDFIGIWVFHDFGIASMRVTIRDLQGSLIENGDAAPYPDHPELWSYLPAVPLPSGAEVLVQVTAVDHMGGIGRWWRRKTMGEEANW